MQLAARSGTTFPAVPCRLVLVTSLILAFLTSLFPVQASATSDSFPSQWVSTSQVTHLWSGPDHVAVDYGPITAGSSLPVVRSPSGPRLFVYVPWTRNYACVDAAAVST
jgi:hypothetical protein